VKGRSRKKLYRSRDKYIYVQSIFFYFEMSTKLVVCNFWKFNQINPESFYPIGISYCRYVPFDAIFIAMSKCHASTNITFTTDDERFTRDLELASGDSWFETVRNLQLIRMKFKNSVKKHIHRVRIRCLPFVNGTVFWRNQRTRIITNFFLAQALLY